MAKKSKGVFGAIGSIWRMTVLGLAVLLLFAIYLNLTGQNGEDVAVESPEAPEVVVGTPSTSEPEAETVAPDVETVESGVENQIETAVGQATDAVNEAAADGERAVGDTVAQVQERVDEVLANSDLPDEVADATGETVADVTERMQDGTDEFQGRLNDALGGLTEGATDAGADAVQDASDAAERIADDVAQTVTPNDEPGPGARPFGELVVPGDDATYELVNAFQRDDGAIEFTTERSSSDGITQTVTRLVTCAPFAVGTISEGDGARIDQPDMERIALGSPEATIGAFACGIFR